MILAATAGCAVSTRSAPAARAGTASEVAAAAPSSEAAGLAAGSDGAPCHESGDCAPGLGCASDARGGTCRPRCGGSEADLCPDGRRCEAELGSIGFCAPGQNRPLMAHGSPKAGPASIQ